jgi:hypothetical protein
MTDHPAWSDALAAALAPAALAEADHPGTAADAALQARVLALYAAELEGLPPVAVLPWLLRRTARLEARLLGLQALALGAPVLPQGVEPARPGALSLPCDAELVQGGFYPAEQAADGTAFRWVGPGPVATVFLPRLSAPLEIRLHVHSAFLPEVLEEVRLALDGGDWVAAAWRDGVLSATLSPGPFSHGALLRLDIDTARTESPEARGGTDRRALSLALSRIEAASR